MKSATLLPMFLVCAMTSVVEGQESSEKESSQEKEEPVVAEESSPPAKPLTEGAQFQKLDLSTAISENPPLKESVITTIQSPLNYTNRLDRLENDRTIMEGGLVPVIKKPSFGSFFQLFNPAAPPEYGGMGPSTQPTGFSRAFYNPVSSEPSMPLFSIGLKPDTVESETESDSAE